VVISPKFRPWWILWIYVCMWLVHAPKVPQLCTNQLLFGFCRSMWIIDSLFTCPSLHLEAPTHLFTPKMLQVKEHTQTFSFFVVFTFGFTFEFVKGCGGVSHHMHLNLWMWLASNLLIFLLKGKETQQCLIKLTLN
jgi:hypothetical protein